MAKVAIRLNTSKHRSAGSYKGREQLCVKKSRMITTLSIHVGPKKGIPHSTANSLGETEHVGYSPKLTSPGDVSPSH